MSIYEGPPVAQAYASGFDRGRFWAEADAGGPRDGIAEDLRAEATTARETAISEAGRALAAYQLGLARGYREEIR